MIIQILTDDQRLIDAKYVPADLLRENVPFFPRVEDSDTGLLEWLHGALSTAQEAQTFGPAKDRDERIQHAISELDRAGETYREQTNRWIKAVFSDNE